MAEKHSFWDLLVFYGFLGVTLASVVVLVSFVMLKSH